MDRELLAQECLEIEKRGGDVLGYLKERGCISPWGTWHRLQKEQLGRKNYQITKGKGEKNMARPMLTDEDRREAVRIAIEGGNPYEFMRSKGIKCPEASWHWTKKLLKENDPDTFAKLPKQLPKTAKTPETPETPEMLKAPIGAAPLKYLEYTVETIRDETLGSFHYDEKHRIIDWTSADRLDSLSVGVDDLVKFLHSAPTIFGILGVDIND